MMRWAAALLAGALLASSAPASALEPPDAGDGPREWLSNRGALSERSSTRETHAGGGRALLGLLGLGALAGAALVWRHKKQKAVGGALASVRVEVLGSTRVGPKAHAVVARVGSKVVLLGVTDHSVQRLAWMKSVAPAASPAPAPAPRRLVESPPPRAPAFAQVLRDAFGLADRRVEPRPEPEPALVLAEETRDVYEGPTARVETQAAGLVARLRELQR